MVSKKLKDHLIVFAITVIVFSVGVSIGSAMADYETSLIENSITEFRRNIESLEVGSMLNTIADKTLSCVFLETRVKEIREELNDLSEQVIDLEQNTKVKDEHYFALKKDYTFIRAEYWLVLTKLRQDCNANYTTILYFYSTSSECIDCRDQGVILAHLSSIKDDLYVVPVDADEDLLIIRTLKDVYNISSTPSMIINSEQLIEGLIHENELAEELNYY